MSSSSFIFLSEFPHPMWSLLTPCMSYNVWGLDELRPIFPQPSNGPGSIFCHSLSDLISRASVEMNLLCTAASVQPHFFLSTRLQRHISQVIEIRISNAALFIFSSFQDSPLFSARNFQKRIWKASTRTSLSRPGSSMVQPITMKLGKSKISKSSNRNSISPNSNLLPFFASNYREFHEEFIR